MLIMTPPPCYADLELWHSGENEHADGGQDEEGAHYDQHLQE